MEAGNFAMMLPRRREGDEHPSCVHAESVQSWIESERHKGDKLFRSRGCGAMLDRAG